jgi:pimeloyl-ACP methyl ester carboxylesterase
MLERRHLDLDGLCLSYLEQGRAVEGEPSLVLLHGLMGCADTFLPLIESLGQSMHLIALDLPGAGQSERREDIDASLAATAKLVHHFLDALQLHQPVLLGHSHGGAVAMSLGAHRPGLLRSLILLAPAHPYFEESDPVVRFYLTLPGRLFAYSMPWYPEWVQLFALRRMAGRRNCDTAELLRPYRDNLRTPGTMSHLLRLLQSWKKDFSTLGKALRKPLATPSLLVWGDHDRAVPVHSASALREHLQHSQLHVLPGIGHRPAEEMPAVVATLVHDWLQSAAALAPATPEPVSIRYSANISPSHSRIAELIPSSFEAGD